MSFKKCIGYWKIAFYLYADKNPETEGKKLFPRSLSETYHSMCFWNEIWLVNICVSQQTKLSPSQDIGWFRTIFSWSGKLTSYHFAIIPRSISAENVGYISRNFGYEGKDNWAIINWCSPNTINWLLNLKSKW